MLQSLIQFILDGWLPWLTLSIALLLIPLEMTVPRLTGSRQNMARVVAVLVLGFTSLGALKLLSDVLQEPLMRATLPYQFVSIAKLPIPDWLLIVVSFLILDLLNYAIHRLAHVFEPLWRLHAIHHADEEVTALTGILHHPLETLVIGVLLFVMVVLLGIPVLVYLLFGLVAAVHSGLSHANIAIPRWIDSALRLLVVTPDMHRTHHSVAMREGNSNFGTILTIWDRLFGTYVAHPQRGESNLLMGLPAGQRPQRFAIADLLLYPVMRPTSARRESAMTPAELPKAGE